MHLRNPNPMSAIHRRSRAAGVSLIELMVGLVIGMIGVTIIMQALQFFEARQRTTVSGSDAQVSGTLAAFELDRDLKQAGMGFGRAQRTDGTTYLGCTVEASNTDRATQQFDFVFAPAVIAQGNASAPADSITVLYGASQLQVAGQVFDASEVNNKSTRSNAGHLPGDLIIVAAEVGGRCAMGEVTAPLPATPRAIQHADGTYQRAAAYRTTAASAPPDDTAAFNARITAGANFIAGSVFNLGSRPWPGEAVEFPTARLNQWAVQNNQLVVWRLLEQDPTDGTDPLPIAENIIDLQAQYGVDDDNDGTTPLVWLDTLTAPIDWRQVQAIRFAVLARSRQYEGEVPAGAAQPAAVTASAPGWTGGAFVMRNLDGSTAADGSAVDWRQYRYRVYENTVALRNMVWGLR